MAEKLGSQTSSAGGSKPLGLQCGATQAMHLPPAQILNPGQRTAVAEGKVVAICGQALAKADLLVQRMGNCEIAWYWVADCREPDLIVDLYLPQKQQATSGHVTIGAASVAAANREVRKRGGIIVAAGHSHHSLGAFSSTTDLELFLQLAREMCGFRSLVSHESVAQLGLAGGVGQLGGEQSATVSGAFEGWPGVELELESEEPDPGITRARLVRQQLRLLSLFSTHDVAGSIHFPLLETLICQCCRSRVEQRFLVPDQLLIFGPVALDVEARRRLLAELEQKIPRRPSWGINATFGGEQGRKAAGQRVGEDLADQAALSTAPTETAGSEKSPEPFEIYRRGQNKPVAVVEAAVLEKAAWKVDELAQALGWIKKLTEDHGQIADTKKSRGM